MPRQRMGGRLGRVNIEGRVRRAAGVGHREVLSILAARMGSIGTVIPLSEVLDARPG